MTGEVQELQNQLDWVLSRIKLVKGLSLTSPEAEAVRADCLRVLEEREGSLAASLSACVAKAEIALVYRTAGL